MACVTLKRPLPESILDNPNVGQSHHSPYHSPHSHRPPPSKRRRCAPYTLKSRPTDLLVDEPSTSSVFRENPFSTSEIANNLRDELKRLKKRRQLAVSSNPNQTQGPSRNSLSSKPPLSPSSASNSDSEPMDDLSAIKTASGVLSKNILSSVNHPISASQLLMSSGKPIFTLKQMTMICEKMCKDRTDQVRQEYDKILQQKLAEQYDAFVKFIDHQIQQRFNQSQLPSYLS